MGNRFLGLGFGYFLGSGSGSGSGDRFRSLKRSEGLNRQHRLQNKPGT